MGFYLGGRHEKPIDKFLEFMQTYLGKEGYDLSKMHTVYFALKFTAHHMLGEQKNWKEVLEEVKKDLKQNEVQFEAEVEKILNRFRDIIREKIKRGEMV